MSASADISGLIKGLAQAQEKARATALQAVDVFGEHVLRQSQQLAPVETGALKASATAEPAVIEGTGVSKRLGYTVSYAAAVHERLDVHHETGQAKFLETAIRNNAPKFNDFVADRMKKAL